jgi:hypothetical protein
MKKEKNIFDGIFAGYGETLWYVWETGELTFDKPEARPGLMLSELYEPPFVTKVAGLEIGSFVAEGGKALGFCGQVVSVWPSRNWIELANGKFNRGANPGSDMEIVPKLKVLASGRAIKSMFEDRARLKKIEALPDCDLYAKVDMHNCDRHRFEGCGGCSHLKGSGLPKDDEGERKVEHPNGLATEGLGC